MNQKEKYYAGVAARAIREISSSVESWTSFLTTMGKNYDFNYPDQVMIHAQRPNATLCMEFDQWKEEKYRCKAWFKRNRLIRYGQRKTIFEVCI